MQQRLQADKEIRITAHASHCRLNLQFNNTRSDTLRFTVKNLKDVGLRMILIGVGHTWEGQAQDFINIKSLGPDPTGK